MTIYRQYRMTPVKGHTPNLEAALVKLAGQVSILPGCEGVEILKLIGDIEGFVFTERWLSIEHHKRGGELLGPTVFAPIGALLEGKPESIYLQNVDYVGSAS